MLFPTKDLKMKGIPGNEERICGTVESGAENWAIGIQNLASG